MERRSFLKTSLGGAMMAVCGAAGADERAADEKRACDVFVYGSTPAGIAAAVEAARKGVKVVLACPKKNPGGMSASGLRQSSSATALALRPFLDSARGMSAPPWYLSREPSA